LKKKTRIKHVFKKKKKQSCNSTQKILRHNKTFLEIFSMGWCIIVSLYLFWGLLDQCPLSSKTENLIQLSHGITLPDQVALKNFLEC
jgi:hypothetical protein